MPVMHGRSISAGDKLGSGTLGIIGLGLIGGSFAKAVRAAGLFNQVAAFDLHAASLQEALQDGVIDEAADSISMLARRSDVIFLAVPVRAYGSIFRQLAGFLQPHAVLTDAGSSKLEVSRIADEHMRARRGQFVPAHPIAGSHLEGYSSSRADLFRNRPFLLTPGSSNKPSAIQAVRQILECLEADVQILSAQEHDEIFACVSHLPHLLAACCMAQIPKQRCAEQMRELSGPGFRDFTRIAASSSELWRDVFLSNKEELLKQVALFKEQLALAESMIIREDAAALQQWYDQASKLRFNWDNNT